MKRFIPRLIAFGVLLLLAAIDLVFHFSTERLIIETAIFVLMAVGVFVGTRHSMVIDMPIFALGWVLVTLIFPQTELSLDGLRIGIERFVRNIGDAFDSEMFVIGLAAVVALQLFFRKSNKLVFILLRYAAMLVLIFGIYEGVYGTLRHSVRYASTVVLLSLLYELKTKAHGYHQRRTIACLLSALAYVFIEHVFYFYITFTQIWVCATIGAAILGGLMILEDYNNSVNLRMEKGPFSDLGLILLAWAVFSLISLLWEDAFNWWALVVVPVVLYYGYGFFSTRYLTVKGGNRNKLTAITWALSIPGLLLLGKNFNDAVYVAACLILLLAAAAACWGVTVGKRNHAAVMTCFFGIAATVMLILPGVDAYWDTLDLLRQLAGVVLISIFWCALCVTTDGLDQHSSDIYKEEYKKVILVQRYVPLGLLAVAAVRMFLV